MNAIPENLRQAIAEALESLSNSADGDLDPIPRFRVVQELRRDGTTWSKRGYKRSVYSEILCTSRVLPRWEASWPADTRPQQLLAHANGFLDDTWDLLRAKEMWRIPPFDFKDDKVACFVLTAAHAAVELAICAVDSPATSFDINLYGIKKNREFDFPDGWDAAFCASVVEADGVAWRGNSDKTRRVEFWRWWLEDAIPISFSKF